MGILKRLFQRDPRKDLDRAEVLLAQGEAAEALRLAQRAAAGEDPGLAQDQRAAALIERARGEVVATALARAGRAEAEEVFDDAAEWLEIALEHEGDPARRGELEARREALRIRAEGAREPELRLSLGGEGGPAEVPRLDPEDHFLALVDMFEEPVAERYEGAPAAFHRAFVDLNEGRVEAAAAVLEELVAAGCEDPVVTLERGRARLMLGDAAGARSDFEAVGGSLGDEPLDRAGTVSLPLLWSDALLELGQPAPVLQRLAEAADGGDPEVALRFALALMQAERWGDARRFLAETARQFPSRPVFPYHLAQVLARLGEPRLAIDCLETAIAPSCAGGGCGRPPKHVPSLRALAALYLDQGGPRPRLGELLQLLAEAQGGELGAADFLLLERFHDLRGDPEAAREAAAEARRRGEGAAGELAGLSPRGPASTPI